MVAATDQLENGGVSGPQADPYLGNTCEHLKRCEGTQKIQQSKSSNCQSLPTKDQAWARIKHYDSLLATYILVIEMQPIS